MAVQVETHYKTNEQIPILKSFLPDSYCKNKIIYQRSIWFLHCCLYRIILFYPILRSKSLVSVSQRCRFVSDDTENVASQYDIWKAV